MATSLRSAMYVDGKRSGLPIYSTVSTSVKELLESP